MFFVTKHSIQNGQLHGIACGVYGRVFDIEIRCRQSETNKEPPVIIGVAFPRASSIYG
jgi:hypothetical protein